MILRTFYSVQPMANRSVKFTNGLSLLTSLSTNQNAHEARNIAAMRYRMGASRYDIHKILGFFSPPYPSLSAKAKLFVCKLGAIMDPRPLLFGRLV